MQFRSQIKRPDKFRPRVSHSAQELAQRYGFLVPGSVRPIVAIISLGGGYSDADTAAYCNRYHLPVPRVTFVSVNGGTNTYSGDPNSADGENALDIQNVIGGSGGMVDIRFYGSPNTSQGFAAAIARVAADAASGMLIAACSISWGQAESGWNQSDMQAMEQAIAACKARGIPTFCASGDNGSSDGGQGQNADCPASCPSAIGVGGTSLLGAETAWTYGGGGPSHVFPRNLWQPASIGNARGVPDMAADADPNSGYDIVVGGQWGTFGGTSAVGPLLAGGVACVVSKTGLPVGDITAAIYGGTLDDITTGSNGAFQAGVGYDYCTGMGVPTAAFWQAVAGAVPTPPVPVPPTPIPPTPVPPLPPVGIGVLPFIRHVPKGGLIYGRSPIDIPAGNYELVPTSKKSLEPGLPDGLAMQEAFEEFIEEQWPKR